MREIDRDYYGHDKRAINKHSTRTYVDQRGRLFKLCRTTDGTPRFFEAYGPYSPDYRGVLPRLKVNGADYWGDGWSWKKAVPAFFSAANR